MTSPLFRRCRRFSRYQLDLHQGAELIAFVRLVGLPAAMWIYGWHEAKNMVRAYKAIEAHAPMAELAVAYEQANAQVLDEETGLAVFQAMRDGGWTRGQVPEIVQRAFQSLRRRGETAKEIAERFGISPQKAQTIMTPPPVRRNRQAEAVAMLVVG